MIDGLRRLESCSLLGERTYGRVLVATYPPHDVIGALTLDVYTVGGSGGVSKNTDEM